MLWYKKWWNYFYFDVLPANRQFFWQVVGCGHAHINPRDSSVYWIAGSGCGE
jgi:hypothetical protein